MLSFHFYEKLNIENLRILVTKRIEKTVKKITQ